jgi:hypothetical protein
VRVVAYLDANSGSMIAAAVAGGLAGVAVVVKLWWRRFVGLFMPKRRAALRAERAAQAAQAADAEHPADADEMAEVAGPGLQGRGEPRTEQ